MNAKSQPTIAKIVHVASELTLVSPQGLELKIDPETGDWKSLVLARSKGVASGEDDIEMKFANPGTILADAFRNDQLEETGTFLNAIHLTIFPLFSSPFRFFFPS